MMADRDKRRSLIRRPICAQHTPTTLDKPQTPESPAPREPAATAKRARVAGRSASAFGMMTGQASDIQPSSAIRCGARNGLSRDCTHRHEVIRMGYGVLFLRNYSGHCTARLPMPTTLCPSHPIPYCAFACRCWKIQLSMPCEP